MDTRILVKHLDATNSGQVEEFLAEPKKEFIIGRDPTCDLQFDPDSDLVSRRHAKIIVSANNPADCSIEDLGSRNGTFVNNQRIYSATKLNSGAVVRMGPGGPEFEFDVSPRPASAIKETRLADSPATSVPPTREEIVQVPPTVAASEPVGKATVQRMVDAGKKRNDKIIYIGVGVAIAAAAIVAAVFVARTPDPDDRHTDASNIAVVDNLSPADIAKKNTDSTVLIEVGWHLVDTVYGKQLYHVMEKVNGRSLPVFLKRRGDEQYEPLLCTDDNSGTNKPIGGIHFGSGFVVSSDGFILTNRHVAAAWYSKYGFPYSAGLTVVQTREGFGLRSISSDDFPHEWIPRNAKYIATDCRNVDNWQHYPEFIPRAKLLEGRNDYLDVAFAKNQTRIPATLSRISDKNDVAMIKIQIPQSLKKMEINDNYDIAKVGDPIVVLGYPAFSSRVVGKIPSKDLMRQKQQKQEIADPTLSTGNIGRIIREENADYYQLTVNSTGAGNSGGPMFDSQGRVVGIFSYGFGSGIASGAVPIRYGVELMGVNSASNK